MNADFRRFSFFVSLQQPHCLMFDLASRNFVICVHLRPSVVKNFLINHSGYGLIALPQDLLGSRLISKSNVPPLAISCCVIQHRSSGWPLSFADWTYTFILGA